EAPDHVLPTASLTSPTANAVYTAPATVELAATAADADGTVARVECFSGTTKIGEDTSSPYTMTGSNVDVGTYDLSARDTDNEGWVGVSGPVSITVGADPSGNGCPCSVFSPTVAPNGSFSNDGEPIQLGMKFRASVNGFATGVRFYKQTGHDGTHTGQLYSSG